MARERKMHPASYGFTLIELMVAVALIMILTVLGTLHLAPFKHHIMRMELDRLQSVCVSMQQHAYATGIAHHIIFENTHNRYRADDQTHTLGSYAHFGMQPGIKGPPAQPVKIVTDPITFPEHILTFYPNGTMSSGTVYITDNSNTTQYALTIGVSPTPYIRQYRYDGMWIALS